MIVQKKMLTACLVTNVLVLLAATPTGSDIENG